MAFNYLISDNLTIILIYIFFYALSLLLLLWIFSLIFMNLNIQFDLSNLIYNNANFTFIILSSVSLFSLAGVPPFIGFFTKLFILANMINFSFWLFSFIILPYFLITFYFYLFLLRYILKADLKIYVPIRFYIPKLLFFIFVIILLAPLFLNDLLIFFCI